MRLLLKKLGVFVLLMAGFFCVRGEYRRRRPSLQFSVGPEKKSAENKLKNFLKTYTYLTGLDGGKRFKNTWKTNNFEKQLKFLHENLMQNQHREYETISPREGGDGGGKEDLLMSIANASFREGLRETLRKQLERSQANFSQSQEEQTTASPVLIENFEVFQIPSNVFLQFTTTDSPHQLHLENATKYITFDTVQTGGNVSGSSTRYKQEEHGKASNNVETVMLNEPSIYGTRQGAPVFPAQYPNPHAAVVNPGMPKKMQTNEWIHYPQPGRPGNSMVARKNIAEAVHQINLAQGINKTYATYSWKPEVSGHGGQGAKEEEIPWNPIFVSSVPDPSIGQYYVTQGWQPPRVVQVTGPPGNYWPMQQYPGGTRFDGSGNQNTGNYGQPQEGSAPQQNPPHGWSGIKGPVRQEQGWTPEGASHDYSGWKPAEGAVDHAKGMDGPAQHNGGWGEEEPHEEHHIWVPQGGGWSDNGPGPSGGGYVDEHSLEAFFNKIKDWFESLKNKILHLHHKHTDKDSFTVSQKVYGKSISILAFIAFGIYVLMLLFQSALATLSIPFLSTIAGFIGGSGGSQIFELLAGFFGRRRLQKYKADLNLNKPGSIVAQEDFIDLERKVRSAFEFFTTL